MNANIPAIERQNATEAANLAMFWLDKVAELGANQPDADTLTKIATAQKKVINACLIDAINNPDKWTDEALKAAIPEPVRCNYPPLLELKPGEHREPCDIWNTSYTRPQRIWAGIKEAGFQLKWSVITLFGGNN